MVNKFHYLKGGSETYCFAVSESLERMGHEVAWFSMEDTKNLPCRQSRYFVTAAEYNGKTSVVKKMRDGMVLIYNPEAKRKFQALCEAFRPEVIHLNLTHRQLTFSILDVPYLKEHAVPVVYTSHDYILVCPSYLMLDGEGRVCDDCLSGGFGPCIRKRCVKGSRAKSALAALEARFLRWHKSYDRIDRIIAPSAFMRDKLIEGGFDSDKVTFMQNFAKDEMLLRAKTDDDLTDRESPYLLFFGRLSREKGIDVLVQAFLRVAEQLPAWRLVIAGDGPERDAIGEMIASSPYGDRVELVGHLAGLDVQEYAKKATLTVASSRCRENMPYSVIESFAVGTPAIGTMIGGIPELVREGETGFDCDPDDVASLSEAIVRGIDFCQDVEAYHLMQRNCRSYVLEHCDQRQYMDALVTLYEELIELKRGTNG